MLNTATKLGALPRRGYSINPMGISPSLLPASRQQQGLFLVTQKVRAVAAASSTGSSRSSSNGRLPPDLTSAPASAPPVSAKGPPTPGPAPPVPTSSSAAAAVAKRQESSFVPMWSRVLWKRLLRELSSLPRAIALMATLVGFSALGTLIPQNKPYEYYIENYPDGPDRVLGFLSYDLLLFLGLDRIYTASYFYLLLFVLACSLAACTSTRQFPAVRVAQRWRFANQPSAVMKQGKTEVLPNASVSDLGAVLMKKGYQVFVQKNALYAFKGLAGRLGPIGVHAALLLVLGGTAYSGIGGFKGNVICPEDSEFVISDHIRAVSPIASRPAAADSMVHVNGFKIDYRPDGSVAQFYSDLSLFDGRGVELQRKTISVNQPFRQGGITMYQTDWSLAAVTLRVLPVETAATQPMDTAESFKLPLASLEGKPGMSGRLWATFLPAGPAGADGAPPPGVSVLARDPQSVVFYDAKGTFVGVRRPGSNKPIQAEGLSIVVDRVVGSTGLEIKSDPGVPWVYAGFGGLMVTTLVSYLSHSQVWALQEGTYVYVAGRTNRAQFAFDNELDEVLEKVPERPPPPPPPSTPLPAQ